MNAEQQEALRLKESGLSRPAIARQMNKTERQVKRLLECARRWRDADPAARAAANAAGSDTLPHSFWVKSDGYSAYYKTKQGDEAGQDFLSTVVDAFKDIPAFAAAPSTFVHNDLCTVYPLFDWHMGMHAWGEETGGDDYDLHHAENDLKRAFGSLDKLTPVGGSAVLILGGDSLHADDTRNETPKSKHKLDTDGRHHKVLETAIRAIAWAVEHLAYRHQRVFVRVLAGNHDPHSHLVLTFALAERYRDTPRVTVDKSPMDLFMHVHGKCLIAAHHGDKSPPQRLAMMLADVCPQWSATRERVILTGHIHHDSSKDFPGVQWRSLRAFCPPDAYGAGFSPRRELRAIVFDAKKGIVLEARDGIARDD